MRGNRTGQVMGAIFLVLGVVWIVVAAVFTVRSSTLINGTSVTARVVGVQVSDSVDPVRRTTSRTYQRTVRYTVDGREYTHREAGASSTRSSVGDTATVFVDRDDPDTFLVDTWMARWGGPLFTALGVLWVALWGWVLWASRPSPASS